MCLVILFLSVGTNNLIHIVSDLTKLAIKQSVLVYQVIASIPTYFNRFFLYQVIDHLHLSHKLPPPQFFFFLRSIELHIFWVIWKPTKTRWSILRMRGYDVLCNEYSSCLVYSRCSGLPSMRGCYPWPAIPQGHQNSLGPCCTCYLESCGSEAPPLEKDGMDEAGKHPALAAQ